MTSTFGESTDAVGGFGQSGSDVEKILPTFPAKPPYGSFILFPIYDAFTRFACVVILTLTIT
jgi:hypothetical protein